MLNGTAVGHLGKEPELRTTSKGQEVTSFSLGVTVFAKGEKQTEWLKCAIWGKRGETFRQFVHKGDQVTVTGSMWHETWQGKEGPVTDLAMEVRDFSLPAKPKEEDRPMTWSQPAAAPVPTSDAIPF